MTSRNPYVILSSSRVYENRWITVTEHAIQKPRGGEGIYGVVHFKNRAVGVVLSQGASRWEDTEELALRRVSVDELLEAVLAGDITDGITVATAFRLKLMRLEGRL
jgi:hypothetical protein